MTAHESETHATEKVEAEKEYALSNGDDDLNKQRQSLPSGISRKPDDGHDLENGREKNAAALSEPVESAGKKQDPFLLAWADNDRDNPLNWK